MTVVRARAVSLAALCAACLALGAVTIPWFSGALAQESPSATPSTLPSDVMVDESVVDPNRQFGPLAGFSGYGGSLGLMRVFGGDLAEGAQLRPVMQATFRYRFDDSWIGVGEFGFGYNSFADRGDTVYAVNFGTIGALRQVAQIKGTVLRAGGGFGFYRWNYKFNGASLRDPVTHRFYRGFAPGVFASVEDELRLTRHVTATGTLQLHQVFNGSDDFERLFDTGHPMLTFRLGVNYHFSPYEGILWERKENRKTVIESRRAGQ